MAYLLPVPTLSGGAAVPFGHTYPGWPHLLGQVLQILEKLKGKTKTQGQNAPTEQKGGGL